MKTLDDIPEEDRADFLDFMSGRTMEIYFNGVPHFPDEDLNRYNFIKGKPEYEWEFIRADKTTNVDEFLAECKKHPQRRKPE